MDFIIEPIDISKFESTIDRMHDEILKRIEAKHKDLLAQ
jgi:hypothetical protein